MIPRHILPRARPNERIGLLGGSFDPPHTGHFHLSLNALRRLRLDRVWWLVTPQNPLKSHSPQPSHQRIIAATKLTKGHPRILFSDMEKELRTQFTADTLSRITALFPKSHFVWLMGADSLTNFHHWDRWQSIAATLPMAILARPGHTQAALHSPAARALHQTKISPNASASLALKEPPAWTFLNMPLRTDSSSALREEQALTPDIK